MISIYNRHYERIAFLSNEAENGIHFKDDSLTTTIPTGVYTFEFTVMKDTPDASALEGGNYVELHTPQGKQLLLTIREVIETRYEKTIYCEDSTLNALNTYVDATEPTVSPQGIEYYINHVIDRTTYSIGNVESDKALIIDFPHQRILERLQFIADRFEVELDFDIIFTPGEPPTRVINFVKTRVEDDEGFRISSDELLHSIERHIEMDNITKIIVRGSEIQPEEEPKDLEVDEDTPTVSERNQVNETAIAEAHRLSKTGMRYQWGGNGNPSYDCSGYVQRCFEVAGVEIDHRATTYTMWGNRAPFRRINSNELERGDLIMYDTGYVDTIPNHVGIYLGGGISSPNSVIHTGDPIGRVARADSMKIVGYVRVMK